MNWSTTSAAVLEAEGRAAAAQAAESAALAKAASVLGNVGQEKRAQRLNYSSSDGVSAEDGVGGSASSQGGSGNRAQRRAAAKKARKRR